MPTTLQEHLRHWVGGWPATRPALVTPDEARAQPGWDGAVHPLAGVVTASGRAAIAVPPVPASALAGLPAGLDALLDALPARLGRPEARIFRGVFRWTTDPVPMPPAGFWLPTDDPRVPPWLHPFGGEVLVSLDADAYVAGVGIKRHDAYGRELAVVTTEAARGRGLARHLVSQAARRVLDEGAIPTYLHAPDNAASAHVADASGFADRGWQVLGMARGA